MRIYVTHCCARKDDTLKESRKEVTPQELYKARPTQRFIQRCVAKGVEWAVFSDLYGVWFPEIKKTWYEKSPNTVTADEFKTLMKDFDCALGQFTQIFFYYNPGRFHPLYRKLLEKSELRERITRITHLSDIT
jgi:hypothetical protein